MKTIAYLTPQYFDEKSYVGGGERYPLNLALGVVEATGGDYQVELLSYGPRAFEKELAPGVILRVMAAAYKPASALDGLSWELPAALGGADVVHIMQAFTRSSEAGYLVAKLLNIPICVTDLGGTSSALGLQFGSLELADRVVCYSDFGAAMLATTTPIVTIKGGVDARVFTPPAVRPVRDRVLYVGRLLPHKGIDKLIMALPPDLPLTCCGQPYHPDFFQRLKQLAVGKNVEFITDGTDATIRDLYARAWVNVLPSQYEDCYGQRYVAPELMGLTLLEAMACGTPVICSRVGAMPEFVRHGETGFVFDTLAELTQQLQMLAANPGLSDRMGAKARRAVEREFDLRVCGVKLADVYADLIAGGTANVSRRRAA